MDAPWEIYSHGLQGIAHKRELWRAVFNLCSVQSRFLTSKLNRGNWHVQCVKDKTRHHSATYISIFEDSMLRSFRVDALVYGRMVIATLIHLKLHWLNWVEDLDVSKRCTRAPSSSCSRTRQSNMANPQCWLAGGQPNLCWMRFPYVVKQNIDIEIIESPEVILFNCFNWATWPTAQHALQPKVLIEMRTWKGPAFWWMEMQHFVKLMVSLSLSGLSPQELEVWESWRSTCSIFNGQHCEISNGNRDDFHGRSKAVTIHLHVAVDATCLKIGRVPGSGYTPSWCYCLSHFFSPPPFLFHL